ncbi:MAG: hypothetical protein K6U12_10230 [Armatimonadetes bacterium]|jgi:hypothetical protein|nr:hypothetical protein [Armatimonadota bacterium]CUU34364.1 hypothetical protein DCOP10_10751 [Armatimonadetes bacterium DC]
MVNITFLEKVISVAKIVIFMLPICHPSKAGTQGFFDTPECDSGVPDGEAFAGGILAHEVFGVPGQYRFVLVNMIPDFDGKSQGLLRCRRALPLKPRITAGC